MNKELIYKKIQQRANELAKSRTCYTRADMAYELRDLGVERDSLLVSTLILEAYNHYNQDKNIKRAFISNDQKQLIIDTHKLSQLVEQNDDEKIFELVDTNLNATEASLKVLANYINKSLPQVFSSKSNIGGLIQGTKGVANIKEEANSVFNNYSSLIRYYEGAKDDVVFIARDFTIIREKIIEIYRTYVHALIDVFGDSIKSISPNMFDFDSVKFLDTQSMLKEIDLEYNSISNSCANLMSEISDNFAQTLQKASSTYRLAGGNKEMGLVLVGLSLFNHYSDSKQKTLLLQEDLITLKNKVKRDNTSIKGDLGRLSVIYKTINDLHIPKAKIFFKRGKEVLSSDLQTLLNSIYSTPELLELKNKRDTLLLEYKNKELQLIDEHQSVNTYTASIANTKQTLKNTESHYRNAIGLKPSKPFFLFNLFSFGTLNKNYNRNLYEWNQNYGTMVNDYEALRIDLTLDETELKQHQIELKNVNTDIEKLKIELKAINKKILEKINVDDKIKKEVLTNLNAIVDVLYVAKDLINSGLDDGLIDTVKVSEPSHLKLPAEIENNIDAFTKSLEKELITEIRLSKLSADDTKEDLEDSSEKLLVKERNDEIANVQENAVKSTLNLLSTYYKLQQTHAQSDMLHEAYDKELNRIQNRFRENLAEIDNKSEVLQQVLKQINLSKNKEELRDGLLSLAEIDREKLTDNELEEFLSGNKIIEL